MNRIQTRGTHCLGCSRRIERIDSHPYGRCILISAATFALGKPKEEVKDMCLFWREDLIDRMKGHHRQKGAYESAVTTRDCKYPVKWEAFCGKCGNSTSAWENQFGEQFGSTTIEHNRVDITEHILLVQMFRASILSIDIQHFMVCQPCTRYVVDICKTMLELMVFHEAVCDQRLDEAAELCKQLKPVMFHNIKLGGKVLYPIVVNVKGLGLVLYAQIPPYYWAVPAPSCEGELTILIVAEIAGMCSQTEKEGNELAKQWKNAVTEPVLIFPFFGKCCIEV